VVAEARLHPQVLLDSDVLERRTPRFQSNGEIRRAHRHRLSR
jgi:hypothetical protein